MGLMTVRFGSLQFEICRTAWKIDVSILSNIALKIKIQMHPRVAIAPKSVSGWLQDDRNNKCILQMKKVVASVVVTNR